jgi:hypothetical protein
MDGDDPNSGGLSRKAIEQEPQNGLDRLGMETVDLYQIHHDTPIETTLRTPDDAVRRGQVRYLGASSMWAHQFADALHTSDAPDLDRFVTTQNHYNLVYRRKNARYSRSVIGRGSASSRGRRWRGAISPAPTRTWTRRRAARASGGCTNTPTARVVGGR